MAGRPSQTTPPSVLALFPLSAMDARLGGRFYRLSTILRVGLWGFRTSSRLLYAEDGGPLLRPQDHLPELVVYLPGHGTELSRPHGLPVHLDHGRDAHQRPGEEYLVCGQQFEGRDVPLDHLVLQLLAQPHDPLPGYAVEDSCARGRSGDLPLLDQEDVHGRPLGDEASVVEYDEVVH